MNTFFIFSNYSFKSKYVIISPETFMHRFPEEVELCNKKYSNDIRLIRIFNHYKYNGFIASGQRSVVYTRISGPWTL